MRSRAGACWFIVAGAAACSPAPPTPASAPSQSTTTTGASFYLSDPAAARNARGGEDPFTPTSPIADPDGPPARLAQPVCERQVECGKQTSMQACLSDARRHAHEGLDRLSCENGLDDARLSDCIAAARQAPCEAGLELVDRIEACAKSRLCAR